jgi:hypothetical protein
MKLKYLITVCCIGLMYATATAQDEKRDMGIAAKFSTNGIGLEYAYEITPNGKFVGRAYAAYLPLTLNGYDVDMMGSFLTVDTKINLGSIGLLCDWHPFKNGFKATAGVSYMITNISVVAQLRDAITSGVVVYTPEDIGKVKADVTYAPVAPYLAVGYGRAIPNKKWNVSCELGTFYTGSPKVKFQCTEMLEPTTAQGSVINENVKSYRWLPQVSCSVGYRLSK